MNWSERLHLAVERAEKRRRNLWREGVTAAAATPAGNRGALIGVVLSDEAYAGLAAEQEEPSPDGMLRVERDDAGIPHRDGTELDRDTCYLHYVAGQSHIMVELDIDGLEDVEDYDDL